MAGNSLDLAWNLIARDSASPAFDRVAVSADRAAASTEAAAAKTEASATRMGSALTKWLAPAAIVAFGVEAVNMASKFQAAMLLVQTQAGASADEVRKMTPAILSLSGKVAQAPEELATSLYHVESTSLRGKAALEAVKVAAEGAAVGHADLEETTNALTATIASGMLPATESYAQAMGQLNTIVGSGDMKLSDLNEALGTGLLVTVKQYGVTLQDVGAALADFGDNNIRGADAATMVRMAVQAISKPSVSAAGDLRRIGLTVEQLQSDEQTGGLNKALGDLHSHLQSSGIAATEWGGLLVDAFTKKAGAGIITLIGTYDRFEQKYKEVGEGATKFGAAWAATQNTVAFQARALEDNIKSLTTSVGGGLTPAVTDLLKWVNQDGIPILKGLGSGVLDVAKGFGDLPTPIRDVALALGALALSNTIGLTGLLASGVGKIGAGFSAAGAAVTGFGDKMAVQSALANMEARSLAQVDAALGGLDAGLNTVAGSLTRVQMMQRGWDTALATTAAVEETTAATTVGFADTIAIAGSRAGGALTSGLSKATAFLGGPWAIAIGAAIFAVPELANGLELFTGHVIDSASATKTFTSALEQTNGAIDQTIGKTAQQQIEQAGLVDIFQRAGVSAHDAIAGIEGNAAAQGRVNKALQDFITHAPDGQGAHSKLATAAAKDRDAYAQLTNSFGTSQKAAKFFGDTADTASTAADKAGESAKGAAPSIALLGSTAGMTKDEINGATKALQAQESALQKVDDAFIDPLKTYQGIAQKMAEATASSTKSSKDSWSDYIDSVKVDLGKYAADLEGQIKNEEDWQNNLVIIAKRGGDGVAQQFADMGVAGANLTAQMATATGKNFSRMAKDMTTKAALGGSGVATALQTKMAVAAAAGAAGAKATVQGIATQLGLGVDVVAAIAKQYGLKLASGINPILASLGKHSIAITAGTAGTQGGGFNSNHWSGGYTGDGGKYEPKGVVHGGEFVLTKEQTAKAGVANLYGLAKMLSGYAAGGFVSPSSVPNPPSTAPYRAPISTAGDATMRREHDAVAAFLSANMFTGGGGGAGSPAMRALGQSIAASMGYASQFAAIDYIFSHESGWNPTAQNPTSTAYGIPQFLDSTWGQYGGKTSIPGRQITEGIQYMANRYGSPNQAAAFWQAHHWYDQGTNYVPSNQLAVLHKGEAVVPASKNQGAPYRDAPITIQLDGPATTALLEGKLVEFANAHDQRAGYSR